MKKELWIICVTCLISLTLANANPDKQSPLFWELSIQHALASRDSYYKINDIDRLPTQFESLLTESGRSTLAKKLVINPDTLSPWFYFLSGIYHAPVSTATAIAHFSRAMQLAGEDPGLTWVLFMEFRQAGQYQWAEKCLRQLERMFLLSDAQAAPIISHQLLMCAQMDASSSFDYIGWSKRFDQHGSEQIIAGLSKKTSGRPMAFFGLCREGWSLLSTSWFVQLRLFDYAYRWLRCGCIAFIIIFFLILGLRALPVALHPLSELYPSMLSPRLRLILSLILFMSTIAFGFIAFLLLAAVLMWPHLERSRNILLSLCVCAIMLAPLDAWLSDVFKVSLTPTNAIGLLHRALDEGYSVETENEIIRFLNKNPRNPLAHLTAATMSLKQKNYDEALIRINGAEKLQPGDPVILLTAGNIHFALGNLEKAAAYYARCITTYPEYEMAHFNLGQVDLLTMKMVEGSDLIARATRLNAARVNTFIAKNDAYFGNSWPSHFMQPDYKPFYFWKNIFPRNASGGSTVWASWSASFFGMPPIVFLILMPLLLGTIFSLQSRSAKHNRVKKIFYCKLCGIPLCKKCKTGQFCIECVQATRQIQHESADQRAESRIVRRRYLTGVYLKMALDCLFPGAGLFYTRTERLALPVLMMIISALVYATYYALISFTFAYPFWIVQKWFIAAALLCGLYSLFGLIRASMAMIFELKTKERIGVA